MSESRRNRTRVEPSSTKPATWAVSPDGRSIEHEAPISGARSTAAAKRVAARVGAALSAARGAPAAGEQNPFASLSEETTVEVDAAALAVVLSRSSDDGMEETRTYQIPEELLALARGDDDVLLPIELRRRGRSSRPAPSLPRWCSARLVMFAHVLVSVWAIGLAYLLVRLL